jgi:hypothetical protein
MDSYQEQKFQSHISEAVSKIRTILENNRSPQVPANVSHSYEGTSILDFSRSFTYI